jgi:hypothetical protein
MTAISTEIVARAAQKVTKYDLIQTEALCDRIHAVQPHVFLTALALAQDGVSMPKMDHVLHVLMVVHIAIEMQTSLPLRTISRKDLQVAHKKHQDMLNYLEAEPDKRMWDLTCTTYPEPVLLAYVLDFLSENGIATETNEDYLVATMSKVILDVYVDALRESEQGKCQPFQSKSL